MFLLELYFEEKKRLYNDLDIYSFIYDGVSSMGYALSFENISIRNVERVMIIIINCVERK